VFDMLAKAVERRENYIELVVMLRHDEEAEYSFELLKW